MKHVITADENIPLVEEAFHNLGTVQTLPGREINKQRLQTTQILLVRSVTAVNREILEGTPVRFVASATAGYDHIDLDYLHKVGIGFANAPGCNAQSAAEYVIAAICYWSLQQSKPLQGLRLGVIGYGQVGSRVVAMAKRLGMSCLVNDPPLAERLQKSFDSIEQVMSCDVVSLHVPLTRGGRWPSYRLFNARRVDALQAGSLLINAARGEVLDEHALLRRLQSASDIHAVIDVWQGEPAVNRALLQHTLLGTPHIAGYSRDGKLRGTQMLYQAVCDYLQLPACWSAFSHNQASQVAQPSSEAQDMRQRVLQAYDIGADSERLRTSLSLPDAQQRDYFDRLRKDYPIRREYGLQLFAL